MANKHITRLASVAGAALLAAPFGAHAAGAQSYGTSTTAKLPNDDGDLTCMVYTTKAPGTADSDPGQTIIFQQLKGNGFTISANDKGYVVRIKPSNDPTAASITSKGLLAPKTANGVTLTGYDAANPSNGEMLAREKSDGDLYIRLSALCHAADLAYPESSKDRLAVLKNRFIPVPATDLATGQKYSRKGISGDTMTDMQNSMGQIPEKRLPVDPPPPKASAAPGAPAAKPRPAGKKPHP